MSDCYVEKNMEKKNNFLRYIDSMHFKTINVLKFV